MLLGKPGELIPALFGAAWLAVGQRLFHVKERHVYKLATGERPLTTRHLRTLETYADQKRRARSQRQQRERDRLERQLKAEAQAEEEATLRLRAITAELRRQGLL